MRTFLHLIDGEMRPARSGRTLDVFDPARAHAYAQVAAGDAQDAADAVAVARRAFPAWAALPTGERARCCLILLIPRGIGDRVHSLREWPAGPEGRRPSSC